MTDITLPDDIWEGVEPGTEALVEQWLVRAGERVAAGQIVARVVVVKTNVEVAAPADGVIEQILVPAEHTMRRGQPLATLRAG